MTNFHTPATGRSQGRIKKGDLLKPDFLIYKANPNGCFTEGGGPDILRVVVEVKSGESLNAGDRHRLRSYFLCIRGMNAVGTDVLLILRGDAYFWYYDELEDDLDTDIFIEITDFLMQWERGEQGVRFDPSQDVPMP
ncbi:hypothetical protein FRC11_000988 [Ceratobasidium sp. 423]|nr:hypothetical protein FRC11_000988 [Ceratobasidium sp. 423]